MSSDLIVNLPLPHDTPDLWRLITENIPQSIRALRARRGFLKPRSVTNLHRAGRSRRSNCAYSSLFTLDAKRTQMRGPSGKRHGLAETVLACCSPRQFLLRTMHSLIP